MTGMISGRIHLTMSGMCQGRNRTLVRNPVTVIVYSIQHDHNVLYYYVMEHKTEFVTLKKKKSYYCKVSLVFVVYIKTYYRSFKFYLFLCYLQPNLLKISVNGTLTKDILKTKSNSEKANIVSIQVCPIQFQCFANCQSFSETQYC